MLGTLLGLRLLPSLLLLGQHHFLHNIFELFHRFVSLDLRLTLLVQDALHVDLELVAEAVSDVSILPHLHVHQRQFVFFNCRQFLFIGRLVCLLLRDESVRLVQVVEHAACLDLLIVVGLRPHDQIAQRLLVLALLDVLQRAVVCRAQCVCHELLAARLGEGLVSFGLENSLGGLLLEGPGPLLLHLALIQSESFDFVAKCVADIRRVLLHAVMLQVLHYSLLLERYRFELLLKEFVFLDTGSKVITYLNNSSK